MTFHEIDEATKESESNQVDKRGRKRKNSVLSFDDASSSEDSSKQDLKNRKRSYDDMRECNDGGNCRTGRWTTEEIDFCDKLIALFKDGKLPLIQGTKLNDFLASMLKSKQSRLTKKMKNAKLSSKIFQGTNCFITDVAECIEFSALEDRFFQAIHDRKERAELKFHMHREWRETFSQICVQMGQPIDADAWLSSVEEMDRRVSVARDASRIARRRLMTGYALSQDVSAAPPGVYIQKTKAEMSVVENIEPISLKPQSVDTIFNSAETDEVLALLDGDFNDKPTDFNNSLDFHDEGFDDFDMIGKSSILHSSPFLNKIMAYIKRHNVPFEHVDVWVPNAGGNANQDNMLGFAGCATTETEIPPSSKVPATPLDSEDRFNFLAFGDYSQKFSFAEGCGLPGRVFSSGVPVWEEKVLTSSAAFERAGGAVQWGITSVLGIPLPSPNVGRIVVCLYSRYERKRDDSLTKRLQDEFSKLLPTPKWKLVIDMSSIVPQVSNSQHASKSSFSFTSARKDMDSSVMNSGPKDPRVADIVNLLGEQLSFNIATTTVADVDGLTGLRLFLLKSNHTHEEKEIEATLLGSYSSYLGCGKSKTEVATMLSRDYSFLTKLSLPQHQVHTSFNHNSYSDDWHFTQDYSHQRAVDTISMHNSNQSTMFKSVSSSSSHGAMDLTLPSDLYLSCYPVQDAYGLDNFRCPSPSLTPIGPLSGSCTVGDNLSVVSN
eukprot:CAMPEP_0176492094 /NCGR_PEP_ID=MMETSP0200_2-20121128/8788_1 /TAXON_ID=947934 /ORGANISM="Chaetoceros sp., Strain GSL56" /LENGTH=717 /DNA_ID=CAMNT_0017889579 /DNA_START=604 /DNA_END=2757 /DNA_ORIENTATION=+